MVAKALAEAAPVPEQYVTYRPMSQLAADEQQQNKGGRPQLLSSPFQVAVASGSTEVVEVFVKLVTSDAEFIRPDPNGNVPLHVSMNYSIILSKSHHKCSRKGHICESLNIL